MDRPRVLFLLGAGISRDVLPLSRQLTDLVLEGKTDDGRVVHCQHEYRLENPSRVSLDAARFLADARARLTWLRGRLAQGVDPNWTPDYEALYFACQQLHDHLRGEYENPLLEPFVALLDGRLAPADPSSESRWRAQAEVRQLREYIAGVVTRALQEVAPDPKLDLAHKPLMEACADTTQCVDVVTLNHDTLLERSLRDAGHVVEDGFGRPIPLLHGGTLARWRGFNWKRGRVRLIKLHGSVDWWRVRRALSDVDTYVRLVGEDPTGIREMPFATQRGSRWTVPDATPEIIVGTFNKMLDYLRPFHLDSLVVFRRALKAADRVIVSGYSFRDKGVNALLIDWVNRHRSRALVVVSPHLEGDAAPHTARGAITKSWSEWLLRRRLKAIKASFHECGWASLTPPS